MEISLGSSRAELLPGRALFLPDSQLLIVADLHLGKSATFRKQGLPVPEGSNASDLSRLRGLINAHNPDQLIIAGDLFHSADGLSDSTIETFHTWLEQIHPPVILTEGNHDRRSWFTRHRFALEVTPSFEAGELVITHDPADLPPDRPGVAGHLHPGVRIKESPRRSMRMTGFLLRNSRHLILPAFSEFTGIQLVPMNSNDQFYAEIKGTISEIPSALIRS